MSVVWNEITASGKYILSFPTTAHKWNNNGVLWTDGGSSPATENNFQNNNFLQFLYQHAEWVLPIIPLQ